MGASRTRASGRVLVVSLAVLVVALGAGFEVVRRHRLRLAEERRVTRERLATLAPIVGAALRDYVLRGVTPSEPPGSPGTSFDGLDKLAPWIHRTLGHDGGRLVLEGEAPDGEVIREILEDSWGRPFVFRFPGRSYARGWEISSRGPSGLEESTDEDALVVGQERTSHDVSDIAEVWRQGSPGVSPGKIDNDKLRDLIDCKLGADADDDWTTIEEPGEVLVVVMSHAGERKVEKLLAALRRWTDDARFGRRRRSLLSGQ